jgi:outer membrane immunogenic protein
MDFIKTGVTMLALIAIPAAAQAQSRAVKRPQTGPATIGNWTGFYGGFNVGYGAAGITDNLPLLGTSLMTGVVGGAQIGYNHQTGSMVLGVEADIQASDMHNTYSRTLPIVGDFTIGHRVPYFGTARGKVGYAFTCGCVMAYATAGIAYGAYEPFASAVGVSVSRTYTNTAVTVGAGVEWMVSQRWSTKLEALYFDTGNIGSGITLPVVGQINARLRSTVTRFGLNYHF